MEQHLVTKGKGNMESTVWKYTVEIPYIVYENKFADVKVNWFT